MNIEHTSHYIRIQSLHDRGVLFVKVRHLDGQVDVVVASAAVRPELAALGGAALGAVRLSGFARGVAHAALLPVLAGVLAAVGTAGGFFSEVRAAPGGNEGYGRCGSSARPNWCQMWYIAVSKTRKLLVVYAKRATNKKITPPSPPSRELLGCFRCCRFFAQVV